MFSITYGYFLWFFCSRKGIGVHFRTPNLRAFQVDPSYNRRSLGAIHCKENSPLDRLGESVYVLLEPLGEANHARSARSYARHTRHADPQSSFAGAASRLWRVASHSTNFR